MADARPTARRATRGDIPGVAAALARAFHDDPVMGWVFCRDARRRDARLRRFFAAEARRYLTRDGLWAGGVAADADTTGDADSADVTNGADEPGIQGGAFWAPPGRWRETWVEMLRSGPTLLPALNWRVPRGLRLVNAMERVHPREAHWYLAILGTSPDAQGHGVGAALMQPILDQCDREGTGAYLESSKESNIPYYERFGFRVMGGEIRPRGGPMMWPMWRDPHPTP